MNTTISNWNGIKPTAIYLKQLKEQPLYHDSNLKMWVACSYGYCKALLLDENAHVPEPFIDDNGPMNNEMKLLLRNLARISNDRKHQASRGAAMSIYDSISKVNVSDVLGQLLKGINTNDGFDWVEVVGKQLPILVILKGLGFNDEDKAYIITKLAALVSVMAPSKTVEDIETLNPVISKFYAIAERYALVNGFSTDALMISNLLGLFIQCYDAGRGLLCNVLLTLSRFNNRELGKTDNEFYNKLVTETLRRYPPVHNTRRVAVKDISLGGETIKAEETVLIVLAAANLDSRIFTNPEKFDLQRDNNDDNLTFGLGSHNCIAKYLSIGMATDTCSFLVDNYSVITILQKEFAYESQLNVRLMKQLMVSL